MTNKFGKHAPRGLLFAFCVSSASALIGAGASAQTGNAVIIQFDDDGESISGELVDFSNEMFRIETSIGPISIPADGVSCIGAACPASTRAIAARSSVVLRSRDGTTELSGDLVGIVDGKYILMTSIGEIEVEVENVTCEGDGCLPAERTGDRQRFVTLRDGDVELAGDLVDVRDDHYLIDSEILGLIRADISRFDCEGDACP